jgi:hypothetical protein
MPSVPSIACQICPDTVPPDGDRHRGERNVSQQDNARTRVTISGMLREGQPVARIIGRHTQHRGEIIRVDAVPVDQIEYLVIAAGRRPEHCQLHAGRQVIKARTEISRLGGVGGELRRRLPRRVPPPARVAGLEGEDLAARDGKKEGSKQTRIRGC